MADQEGKLTEAEKEKALAWVREHQKRSADCPICGSPQWMLGEHLVMPLTLAGKPRGIQLGGIGYPFIMLASPCGYTRFFNAAMIGIGQEQDQPPTPAPKADG